MALLQLPGVLGNITNTIMSSPLLAGIGGGPSGEDCLFLNIQRPAGIAANAALPVMVWVSSRLFCPLILSLISCIFSDIDLRRRE